MASSWRSSSARVLNLIFNSYRGFMFVEVSFLGLSDLKRGLRWELGSRWNSSLLQLFRVIQVNYSRHLEQYNMNPDSLINER